MSKLIVWTSRQIYVDLDTGEVLNKDIVKQSYIIHKKIRHAHIQGQRGIITFTNECRRNEQGELFN